MVSYSFLQRAPQIPLTLNPHRTAGRVAIESADTDNLAALTTRDKAPAKSMMQLKAEADGSGGKRKAEDDDSSRKRVAVGEGEVDKRLDWNKLDEVLKGTAETFSGKPVSEEEMGSSLFLFCSFSS